MKFAERPLPGCRFPREVEQLIPALSEFESARAKRDMYTRLLRQYNYDRSFK